MQQSAGLISDDKPDYFRRSWPDIFQEDRNPDESLPYSESIIRAGRLGANSNTSVPGPSNNPDPGPSITQPREAHLQALDGLHRHHGSGCVPFSAEIELVPVTVQEPNHLECFLYEYDTGVPTREQELIGDFCRNCHHSILAKPDANQRRGAWLDDRASLPAGTSNNSSFRPYKNPLTAAALLHHLKQKRFRDDNLCDADKRIIYISGLDPAYILALIETVREHQVPALRFAFYKHIAMRTALEIDVSTENYETFRMHFHMPHFWLRKKPQKASRVDLDEDSSKPLRTCTDLSFLKSSMHGVKDGNWFMHQANISFTICGVAERRWIAYFFIDADINEDKELDETEFDYHSICADPLVPGGSADANMPSWNPREYFLIVISARMKEIKEEWESLIHRIDTDIRQHIDDYQSTHPFGRTQKEQEDTYSEFEWMRKVLNIVDELLVVLSNTQNVWTSFKTDNGDIGYFYNRRNLPEKEREHIQSLLQRIDREFRNLQGLQNELENLKRRCSNASDELAKRLSLDNHDTTKSSGSQSELTLFWVSPIIVVCAIFSIPQPFGKFQRDEGTFAAGIIVLIALLKLLMLVKGQSSRKLQDWMGLLHSMINSLKMKMKWWRQRHRQPVRSDTEATLVPPDPA